MMRIQFDDHADGTTMMSVEIAVSMCVEGGISDRELCAEVADLERRLFKLLRARMHLPVARKSRTSKKRAK